MQLNTSTANRILEIMAKEDRFSKALNSDIGKILMEDLMLIVEEKVKMVINFTATDVDNCILKSCIFLLERWNEKIKNYGDNLIKHQTLIQEASKKL